MPFRTPKPLEAAILLVLAAVVDRYFINGRSEQEIHTALRRAGHHPSKNVFRLTMNRMEKEGMIVKSFRLLNGRVYSQGQYDECLSCGIIEPEMANPKTEVYGVSDYYISKITGAYLEEHETPPTLGRTARAAAELFCQNAWGRSAYAVRRAPDSMLNAA